MVKIETAVRIEVDFDRIADSFPHCSHSRDVFANHLAERTRLIASLQRRVAHGHLQTSHTTRGPCHRRLHQRVQIVETEPEGIARPTEQAPHRLTKSVSLDVPQRDIDCRNCVQCHAGLPSWCEFPVELVPDSLVIEWIHANDVRRGKRIDHVRDEARVVGLREDVGFNFHDAHAVRRIDGFTRDIERDRYIQRVAAYVGNLHGLWLVLLLLAHSRCTRLGKDLIII